MHALLRRILVVTLLLAALGGCAERAAPRAERTLRLNIGADPPSLNPLLTDNWNLNILSELWHGFLLRTDENGRAIPDLVVRVPTHANGGIAADGLTIRYDLRRGVRWQDGAPFDARDVVFSFAAVRNARNNVVDRSGYDDIARVEAHGPYAVRVTLKRRYSPAVATFFATGSNAPYAILPAHLLAALPDINRAAYNALPVGLGPYRVVAWRRGSRIALTRDPHYFRGAAHIANIEIESIPNPDSELTDFRSGGLDFYSVTGLSGSDANFRIARAVPHTTSTLHGKADFDYLELNVARPPLDELAVRRAIAIGVDAERLMHVLSGELHVPGTGDRAPGTFAYDPTIRRAPFDQRKAEAMLDAAGWKRNGDAYRSRNGRTLTLDIVAPTGYPFFESFCLQMQSALQALGIDARVHLYPEALLESPLRDGGILAGGRYDLTLSYWSPGNVNDHSYLFRCDQRPPNGSNFGRICDPRIDGDAARELQAMDPTVEIAADRAILRRVLDQADTLFFGFERAGYVWRDDIAGVRPTLLGRTFWNVADWRFTSPS